MKSKNMIPGGWERERTISLSLFFFFGSHWQSSSTRGTRKKKEETFERINLEINGEGNEWQVATWIEQTSQYKLLIQSETWTAFLKIGSRFVSKMS